ncbi:MAG: hypothetical protein IPN68_17715 [Bacteroidetes bacterium]|nr:hypothetical protein [Bacteroidota bacterium]
MSPRKAIAQTIAGRITEVYRRKRRQFYEERFGFAQIDRSPINVEDFTSPGKIILPGQPVGLISDSTYISVNLLKVSENSNILIRLPVSYAVGESETAYFSNIDGKKAIHIRSVIEKELKARDLKKNSKK